MEKIISEPSRTSYFFFFFAISFHNQTLVIFHYASEFLRELLFFCGMYKKLLKRCSIVKEYPFVMSLPMNNEY